jgi:hypothetical protein
MVSKLKQARELAQVAMAAAQEGYEEFANRSRDPAIRYNVGDKVWLNFKGLFGTVIWYHFLKKGTQANGNQTPFIIWDHWYHNLLTIISKEHP